MFFYYPYTSPGKTSSGKNWLADRLNKFANRAKTSPPQTPTVLTSSSTTPRRSRGSLKIGKTHEWSMREQPTGWDEQLTWSLPSSANTVQERVNAFGDSLLSQEDRQNLLQHPEQLQNLDPKFLKFAGLLESSNRQESSDDQDTDVVSLIPSDPTADRYAAQSFSQALLFNPEESVGCAYLFDRTLWDNVLLCFENNWQWIISNRIPTNILLPGKQARKEKDKIIFSKVYDLILMNLLHHEFHEGAWLLLIFFGAILFSVGTTKRQRNTRLVWIEKGEVVIVLEDFFNQLKNRRNHQHPTNSIGELDSTPNGEREEKQEGEIEEVKSNSSSERATQELQNQLPQSRFPPSLPSAMLGEESIFKKVASLVEREDYSRALQEFDKSKVLPLTDDVKRQLLEKHPGAVHDTPIENGKQNYLQWVEEAIRDVTSPEVGAQNSESSLPSSSLSPTSPSPPTSSSGTGFPESRVQVTRDLVDKSLRGLSKNSAPGPSGLRYEHLQWFLTLDETRDKFCRVIEAILNGEVPARAKEILVRGSLTALDKGGGKVRPICVCESIRKLASRVALASVANETKAFFHPIQVGVGTRNGSESIFHESDIWWSLDQVVGTVDISNAFNSFDRRAIMLKTFEHFPALFSYVKFLYEDNNQLLVQEGEFLSSERGAVQGDPLSPFLFALVIQDDLTQVKKETGVEMCAYCDDISVFHSDVRTVADALARLVIRFKRSGFSCNLDKSRIFLHASEEDEEEFVERDRIRHQTTVDEVFTSFPSSCSVSSSVSSSSVPSMSTIPVELVPGFKTMGGYVGEQAFVKNELSKKVQKVSLLIDRICAFGESGYTQHAYALLKLCIVPKFNHIVRLQGKKKIEEVLHLFDSKVVNALCRLLRMDSSILNWWQKETIHLPVRLGGFGLPSTVDTADIAHFASLKESKNLIENRVNLASSRPVRFFNFLRHEFLSVSEGLAHLLQPNVDRKIQKELTKIRMADKLKAMLAISIQEDFHYRLRTFFMAKLGQFSRWLNVVPAIHTFKDEEFIVVGMIWLGVKKFGPCARCTSDEDDLLHLLKCSKGSYINRRHNHLYRLFKNASAQCGIQCSEEPRGEIGRVEMDENGELANARRPDLVFPNLNGRRVIVDVTFSFPWRSLGGRRAYFKPSITSVVKLREDEKLRTYSTPDFELVKGQLFFPAAAEPLGVVGDGFRAILNQFEKALWRPVYKQLLTDLQVFIVKQLTWAIPKQFFDKLNKNES